MLKYAWNLIILVLQVRLLCNPISVNEQRQEGKQIRVSFKKLTSAYVEAP